MVKSVFRPSRLRNGKRVRSRLYVGRYKLDGDTELTQVPLGTSDKQSAESVLSGIILRKERERCGLLPAEEEREAALLPLEEHLAVFIAGKERTSSCPRYVKGLNACLSRLFSEAGWKLARDISSDSFARWQQRQTRSAKTINEYIVAARSFTKWLRVHRKALAADPLESISAVSTVGRETFSRRALSLDEIERLIAASGPRRPIYALAIYTGLRRNELRQLEWGDLKVAENGAYLLVRASTTKNQKSNSIPLHPIAEKELGSMGGQHRETDQIFPIFPRVPRFWKDLEAAGIERIDARGKKVDFHSLRMTFCTLLNVSGANLRVAMEAMRHSDPKLTMKTYTDSEMLPVRDAISRLPAFGDDSQIDSQNLVGSCPVVSRPDATGEVGDDPQMPINKAFAGELAVPVASARDPEDGGRCRFRTCDPRRVKAMLYR